MDDKVVNMSDAFYFDKCPKCGHKPEDPYEFCGYPGDRTTCRKCGTEFVVTVELKEYKEKKRKKKD